MAKAILEFDLSNPDDVNDYKRTNQALDMALALWDIDQYLRAETKYNEELTQDAYDALATAREKFYQILNEHNINMDEILK
jgi:hypothetical protein